MDVIIFQTGYFYGLRYCLESIACHSPQSKVHIIGENIPDFRFTLAEYGEAGIELEKTYAHFSVNSREFEIRCLKRWFAIYYYAMAKDIREFFTCDSDVLVMDSLEENARFFRDYDFTMPMGSGYWFNTDKLKEYYDYILYYYGNTEGEFRKKVEHEYRNEFRKAISDMTLADYFSNSQKVCHAAHGDGPVLIDDNLALIDGWESVNGFKKIYFENGKAYAKRLGAPFPVQMLALHCWGRAKQKMPWYFQSSLAGL